MTMEVGGNSVDPTGVVASARDEVHVAIAEAFGGAADSCDAALIEGDRVEGADFLDLESQSDLAAISWAPTSRRWTMSAMTALSGERKSTVKTHLPGMMLRLLG